ncbi:hypothetical protein [Amycolatopsis benzoatilytica]|uniref:hypothetical protein n=1 Tax=Amycolatopsis benzoatilytica TaxID=346045 RepID=UPI0003621D8C|nr:hypothetical protein [Amycolatopsis benzoatilytica]
MNQEQQRAEEALAAVRTHQDQARRAARLPWWTYALMFVLTAGFTAANDFVTFTGSKFLAVVILVLLVVVFAVGVRTRSAPLSRLRGVQPTQGFVPWVFGVIALIGGVGGWLISRYGTGFAATLADGLGLREYPCTVAGVLFGLAFTALFALSQALLAVARRRGDQ